MPTESKPDALPLPALPAGDPAEQRVLAYCAATVRDSQDDDTIRAAIYIAAAALRAIRAAKGK
jgi:hypothetical protein